MGTAPADHGPTMKALLQQYTQYANLAQAPDGEDHLLFPADRVRQTGKADQKGKSLEPELQPHKSDDRVHQLLRMLDKDQLPNIKRKFLAHRTGVHEDEFVAILQDYVEHVEGAEERSISADLKELFAQLSRNTGEPVHVKGEGRAVAEVRGGEAPTPDNTYAYQPVVSWSMLAKLLLDEGVVGSMLSSFNIAKVLRHIEREKITPLHDEFYSSGNALSLDKFVILMKEQFRSLFELTSLFDLHDEEDQLFAQLINLYEMIDIDGRGTMSWEDFTGFLMDQMKTDNLSRELNTIRFNTSPTWSDSKMHQSNIEKVFYFKQYDKVAFIEQGIKSLKMCTPGLEPCRELKGFSRTPLWAEYIAKYSWVAVSCSDHTHTLCFYDMLDINAKSTKPNYEIHTGAAQHVMCWSDAGNVLFTADFDGTILPWDLSLVKLHGGTGSDHDKIDKKRRSRGSDKDREKDEKPWEKYMKANLNPRDRPMCHGSGDDQGKSTQELKVGKSIVTMLLELPTLNYLASCGIDKNVMIWDISDGKPKRFLKGHTMGVCCMAFAASTKELITGGFDYKLFVWNPYAGIWIKKIHGHAAPIVGIEVLGSGSSQVVSADLDGVIKIWDLHNYECLQKLELDAVNALRAFVSIPSHKRILAAERRFFAFDYQNTGAADRTDEAPIIKAVYHHRLQIFVSGCKSHVRVWDAVTGSIKCVIQHREPDVDITDFCVDDRGRKIIIADHNGNLLVHNSSTGCYIKKLTKHKKEVSGVIYCWGDRNVITVSWDSAMFVHDETADTNKVWRKLTNVHDGDITCVAFSRHLGLIATGSTDCVIAITEYERLRGVSSLIGHRSDITCLSFVEPLPLLVSSDLGGNVALWAVPAPGVAQQHRYVNHILIRFLNMHSLDGLASVNCFDALYIAEGKKLHVYTGDEEGEVRGWDLTTLLQVAELGPCAPKADWDPRKNLTADNAQTAVAMARQAADISTPELPMKIHQPCVKKLFSTKAHDDSIRTLYVYASPGFILTAGYDNMVKLWTMDGNRMTVLRAFGSIPWVFPVQSIPAGVDEQTLAKVKEKVASRESAGKAMMKIRATHQALSLHEEVERHKNRLKASNEAAEPSMKQRSRR